MYGERVEDLSKFPPQAACSSQTSIEDNVIRMKTLLVCGSTVIHSAFSKCLLRAFTCQAPFSTTGLRVKTQISLSSSGPHSGEEGKQRRVCKRCWWGGALGREVRVGQEELWRRRQSGYESARHGGRSTPGREEPAQRQRGSPGASGDQPWSRKGTGPHGAWQAPCKGLGFDSE